MIYSSYLPYYHDNRKQNPYKEQAPSARGNNLAHPIFGHGRDDISSQVSRYSAVLVQVLSTHEGAGPGANEGAHPGVR